MYTIFDSDIPTHITSHRRPPGGAAPPLDHLTVIRTDALGISSTQQHARRSNRSHHFVQSCRVCTAETRGVICGAH
jgi:hypothetical protein